MYIYVIDEQLKNTLLSKSYNLIKKFKDINDKTIWIFEDNSNRFSIDIQSQDIKSKCFTTDRLTMSF